MISSEAPTSGGSRIIDSLHSRNLTRSMQEDGEACALPILDISTSSDKHAMANVILNDILETAMDIAEGDLPCNKNKMNLIDNNNQSNNSELRNIIEGLSKINVDQGKKTSSIDQEMKRMLSEIMTNDRPQNLGIGDSPPIDREHPISAIIKPSKMVEKKTRVTDLVMNSTKVITNILNEEQRRKQDEWEEANEHVIQVIELQQNNPPLDPLYPETFPLPYDEFESDLLLIPEDSSHLESIDLAAEDAAAGTSVGGKGDNAKKAKDSKSSTLNKLSNMLNAGGKRKKWLARFKFCNFRRHRKDAIEEIDDHVEGASSAMPE